MVKLSTRIREMIERQVKSRGIVVWFDPEKAYTKFVRDLNLPDTSVMIFHDTFFRLRHELEPHLEFVTAEGRPVDWCGVPPNVVVYVPMAREETSHALIETESAGVVVEPGAEMPERNSRLRVQAEAFFQDVAPERAAQLARQVDEGLLTLEDLDRISEELGSLASSVLKLVFGPASPLEVIIAFAASEAWDVQIIEKKALNELRDLVSAETGLDFGPAATPAEARQTLRRLLLLAEFVTMLAKDSRPSAFDTVPLPETEIQLSVLRHLCSTWRNRIDFREGYVEAGRAVEVAVGIDQMKIPVALLEGVETFPCVETRLLHAAEKALGESEQPKVLSLAKTRQTSFWSLEDPVLRLRWHLLELAAKFLSTAEMVRQSLKRLDLSASEMIRAYALFSEPWMLADSHFRHWESRLLNVDPEESGGVEKFEKLTVKIRREHALLLDEMNRAFSTKLEAAGFELRGCLHQGRVFVDRVAPMIQEGEKTVYFLVDALRYEMAHELVNGLEDSFVVKIEPAIACLPSITSVGMSSLLPGAEKGMELIATGGRLAVGIDGQVLKDRQGRIDALSRHVHDGFTALKLSEILRLGAKRKKEISSARFIVITSQEIDRLGEDGDDQAETRRWMDEVLDQLRRAVRILARHDFKRFVISADHGYLFVDDPDPGMMMDSPGGTTVELHPRVWVGKGGTVGKGYIRATASQLELGGELELAFPRGLACFRVKGGVGGSYTVAYLSRRW